MQRLLPHREAQYTTMKIARCKPENCISQRVLPKQIRLHHVRQQTAGPGQANADPARLVNRPVEQYQSEKIRPQCQRKTR